MDNVNQPLQGLSGPMRFAQMRRELDSELHLWRADAMDNAGKTVLEMNRMEATAIDHQRPMLIILPGMNVSHQWQAWGMLGGVVASELKMLGGAGVARDKIDVAVVTYPDTGLDPDLYRQMTRNTEGPPANPYSPIAQQLSQALLGPVLDCNYVPLENRQSYIDTLHNRLRTKVVTGMSAGSQIAEGLQNAMMKDLTQRGWPHQEIMSGLKIMTYDEIGFLHRRPEHQDVGATAIHVSNTNDSVAKNSVEQNNPALISDFAKGQYQGSTLVRVGANEMLLRETLPEYYTKIEPYKPDKHEQNGNVIGVGLLEGREVAVLIDVNPNGHGGEAHIMPIGARGSSNYIPGVSNTNMTGAAPGNTLREMMLDAMEQAADPALRRPMPDIMTLVATPVPSLTHQGHPTHDPLYQHMQHVGYEKGIKKLAYRPGEVQPLDAAIRGDFVGPDRGRPPTPIGLPEPAQSHGFMSHIAGIAKALRGQGAKDSSDSQTNYKAEDLAAALPALGMRNTPPYQPIAKAKWER